MRESAENISVASWQSIDYCNLLISKNFYHEVMYGFLTNPLQAMFKVKMNQSFGEEKRNIPLSNEDVIRCR